MAGTLKYILILLLLFSCNVYATDNIYGLRYDYLLHYESGIIMGITISKWNESVFNIKEDYGLYSIGIPVIIGLLKEFRDYKLNNNNFPKDSLNDFCFTVTGAITGKLLSYTF